MGYTVFRSDRMPGTDVRSELRSCRVYDGNDEPIAVENGTIVELKGYEDGQREVMKAVLATEDSDIAKCAVIGSEEVMYDERKKNLDEFINGAGAICRAYLLHGDGEFSVTAEGFDGDAPEAAGSTVGVGTDGKIKSGSTGLGTISAI